MKRFDVAPFTLPGGPSGVCRFEEPRDIQALRIRFSGPAPRGLRVEYLQKTWPRVRAEEQRSLDNPSAFGWVPVDDQYNGTWRRAAIRTTTKGTTAEVGFLPLSKDRLPPDAVPVPLPESVAAVTWRRTLGIRVIAPASAALRGLEVFTTSPSAPASVRVRLDAGRRTPGARAEISAYNARIESIEQLRGVSVDAHDVRLGASVGRAFTVRLSCMAPEVASSGDWALLTIALPRETFTVSLHDLRERGQVWYAEQGIYLTLSEDSTTFAEYREHFRGAATTLQRVKREREQSFAGPFLGQPRGHAVNFSLGCPRSPQRFWLETNGDLVLHRGNLDFFGRRPELAVRMRTRGTARFFFGLERWIACARYADPAAVPVYTILSKKGGLLLEQVTLCVPLLRSIHDGPLAGEEPTVALLRFRFTNRGNSEERAALSVAYSQDSARSRTSMLAGEEADDYRVPASIHEPAVLSRGRMTTGQGDERILRAAYETSTMSDGGGGHREAVLHAMLPPGESCETVLKVPFVVPEGEAELSALTGLAFDACREEVTRFWPQEGRRGSRLSTPEPHLDAVHDAHLPHVLFSDIAMPGNPGLVNTSVGSSTYGNYANEACMVIQELDQRGLASEVEQRLQVFVDYAGTVRQPGNFTDFKGSFYGAGGWESGDYNQHHGWALWYLAEHFLLTGDRAWFETVAQAVVAGADWIFRQRRTTMGSLPFSRGWEKGFLPAGSLEDVTDFQYWLSTNALTWRGADAAARALEKAEHPEAVRVRAEADGYRRDLLRGFTLSRQHAPLVPLRDGRWVPHFPSRLYRRGRDTGWLREVLEGAVYLLISGLFDAESREAAWILDDYQDNLYHSPPFGYVMRDPEVTLRHRGGFSIQPNLLAGLMPHLERDEIEVYLWMFFNAWAACYREEVDGMIEHPMPELGFHNPTAFKTSDEANAVMWLRAMVVYSAPRLLHLGRALPRAWLEEGEEVRIAGARTHYGDVSARWVSELSQGRIVLEAELKPGPDAPRFLARFRHPSGAAVTAVTVNGEPWSLFDPARGDVDVTGLRGALRIVAEYQVSPET